MKTQMEIQRMHDILTAVMLGEVPVQLKPDTKKYLHASADVLCWILEHDHNVAFASNMANLEKYLSDKGFVLESHEN